MDLEEAMLSDDATIPSMSKEARINRRTELQPAHAWYQSRGGKLDLTVFAAVFDMRYGSSENLRHARSIITNDGNRIPASDIVGNGIYAALLKCFPEDEHPDKNHEWRLTETLLIKGSRYK